MMVSTIMIRTQACHSEPRRHAPFTPKAGKAMTWASGVFKVLLTTTQIRALRVIRDQSLRSRFTVRASGIARHWRSGSQMAYKALLEFLSFVACRTMELLC